MTDQSLNDCRRDFEAWAESHFVRIPHYDHPCTHKNDSQQYHYGAVQQSWVGWKAAWELQDARVKGCLA